MSKVTEVLNSIIKRFKTGDIPQAISYSAFPNPETPSAQWSLLNRTLLFMSGTHDARGFRQWKEANRYVKKGSKAIHILVPRFKKNDEDELNLIGFMTAPVFKYEDTDGDPIPDYLPELPELPFIEVAEEWGISVKAVPGNYKYYGYFSSTRNEIALATEEETVFFHELCHAAHNKVTPLKPGQDPFQEIVAELGASVLCLMVGKESKYLGNNWRYIERYAEKAKMSPLSACLRVFKEVEQVINLITKKEVIYEDIPA